MASACGASSSTADLEERIEELEQELAALSGTTAPTTVTTPTTGSETEAETTTTSGTTSTTAQPTTIAPTTTVPSLPQMIYVSDEWWLPYEFGEQPQLCESYPVIPSEAVVATMTGEFEGRLGAFTPIPIPVPGGGALSASSRADIYLTGMYNDSQWRYMPGPFTEKRVWHAGDDFILRYQSSQTLAAGVAYRFALFNGRRLGPAVGGEFWKCSLTVQFSRP